MVFSLADMEVRPENAGDHHTIRPVNDGAFGQPGEGLMVNALRDNHRFVPGLSLIATSAGAVVGQIIFFPIDIITPDGRVVSISLAPMAGHPDLQAKRYR